MGKIVKYCSTCNEGFSEKFGFCPNCASQLQAYEMNPVGKPEAVEEPFIELADNTSEEPVINAGGAALDDTLLELPVEDVHKHGAMTAASTESVFENDDEPIEIANADVIEPVPVSAESVNAMPEVSYDGAEISSYEPSAYTREDDGGYYVTVIQEKNGKQRNLLLLGSFFFMTILALGATIVSLFQKDLGIGAIGDERSLVYLIDDVPVPIDDKPEIKKEDDGGGGGGGGKNDPKPVNQGDPPDQTPDPIRPPDPKIPKLSNPELVLPPATTQGVLKTEKKFGQFGDPNSKFGDLSSGPGSGGGMGTGIGTGAGSGRGTGMGSGSGSGAGSGNGDGYGDGDGDGSGRRVPPPAPVGVTSAVKILSKPQAKYNDAGRTQGIQGSVRLKVTLLASGQIGSITPVTRLPAGLTEQAIAAARMIRFEPAKQNGIPISKTVTMEYTFSIY